MTTPHTGSHSAWRRWDHHWPKNWQLPLHQWKQPGFIDLVEKVPTSITYIWNFKRERFPKTQTFCWHNWFVMWEALPQTEDCFMLSYWRPSALVLQSHGEVVLPERFPGWKDGRTVKLTTVNNAQWCGELKESLTYLGIKWLKAIRRYFCHIKNKKFVGQVGVHCCLQMVDV